MLLLNKKRDDYFMASMTSAININVDKQMKDEATTILKGFPILKAE